MKQEINIRKQQDNLVKVRDEQIRKYYNMGLSMDDIVKIMKHGKHTVYNAIHQKSKAEQHKPKKIN